MNNNINPHLYDIYLHLRDTLNAKMVHRRKRKTANSIEIVFLCDAINALSGRINTLKEAEACGFWIVCRRQTGKKHAFYHGLPVFQLFLTPVHPKKALENKIQAANKQKKLLLSLFASISTNAQKPQDSQQILCIVQSVLCPSYLIPPVPSGSSGLSVPYVSHSA